MRELKFFSLLVAATLCATGCGSRAAGPLDIYPGLSRAQTDAALRARDYCRESQPIRKTQTYRQCHRPGVRFSYSWVEVEYDQEILQTLQRFERHHEAAQATERWNALVVSRTERLGPASPGARERLLEIRGLPPGTQSWAAWYGSDSRILIGVYLLRPDSPKEPDIIEAIISDPLAGKGSP